MKTKVINYKGFKIQETNENMFYIFTLDEWAYGNGLRSYEWEAGTIEEAREFIDGYNK